MSNKEKLVKLFATAFIILGVLICIYIPVVELSSYQDVVFADFVDSNTYIRNLITVHVLVVLMLIAFNTLPIILSSVFRKKGLYRLLPITLLLHITNICFHSFHFFLPPQIRMETLSIIGVGDIYYIFFGGFNKLGTAHLAFIIANILLFCLNIFYMIKNTSQKINNI